MHVILMRRKYAAYNICGEKVKWDDKALLVQVGG